MNYKTENIKQLIVKKPLKLDCGETIKDFPLAYETYGTLNENKDNAILIFHALTGDQFASGINPITKREGWWASAVGGNKAIDTKKYFVICANVLGGCMGTFGPKEINKKTNEPYGLNFPVITIKDMVVAQESLLDYFKIEKLLCVMGGSMGGMQVLQFCSSFPDRAFSAIPIACSSSHSAQNIALNELARQAIMADPEWSEGSYGKTENLPKNGLAVARMAGHISYLSESGLQEKFGRKLQERIEAFKGQKTKFLVISFSSDWLYPTKHSKDIVIALNASGANVAFAEIKTDKGHDSFLVNEPKFLTTIKGFVDSTYKIYKR